MLIKKKKYYISCIKFKKKIIIIQNKNIFSSGLRLLDPTVDVTVVKVMKAKQI